MVRAGFLEIGYQLGSGDKEAPRRVFGARVAHDEELGVRLALAVHNVLPMNVLRSGGILIKLRLDYP
jgi:hypothetical protein